MASIYYAITYTIIVFAFGFAFGIVRTKYVAPKIGKLYAVLFESPLIIIISYFVVCFLNGIIFTPNRILISAFSIFFLLLIEFLFAHLLFKLSFSKFLSQ